VDALVELVEKYRLLEELHRGEPGRTVERRDAMRAIAERFPAAMREWDEASRDELRRRRGEVERVLAILVEDGARGRDELAAPANAWMRYSAQLHRRLRELLRVKRWLAGRAVDDALAAEAARAFAPFAIDRALLERVASPPGGRVAAIAYAEVAARNGVTVDEMKAFLFPHDEEEP